MEQNTSEEEKVCEFCQGTGYVATTWTNPETHLEEPDGEEVCVCRLPQEDEEIIEE